MNRRLIDMGAASLLFELPGKECHQRWECLFALPLFATVEVLIGGGWLSIMYRAMMAL